MARTSREGQFRIEQRVGESLDITILRAFAKSLPYMERDAATAAARWMLSKSQDPLTIFGGKTPGPEFERAFNKYLRRATR